MRSNGPAHIIQYDTWSQKLKKEGITFKQTNKNRNLHAKPGISIILKNIHIYVNACIYLTYIHTSIHIYQK